MPYREPEFYVISGRARRQAVAPDIRRIAEQIRREAVSRTPSGKGSTGDLAAGWEMRQGRDPGTAIVTNTAQTRDRRKRFYARWVEYGTRRRPARPMLGPAVARWRAKPGYR